MQRRLTRMCAPRYSHELIRQRYANYDHAA
jgi:hypothetical protein